MSNLGNFLASRLVDKSHLASALGLLLEKSGKTVPFEMGDSLALLPKRNFPIKDPILELTNQVVRKWRVRLDSVGLRLNRASL